LSETREPAEEPLWGEQPLLGVDPDKTPKVRIGDQFDEPGAVHYDLGEGATVDRIAQLLGPSPISLDDLARMAELDVAKVRMAVIELEIAGRIERSGGDRVALLPADDPD